MTDWRHCRCSTRFFELGEWNKANERLFCLLEIIISACILTRFGYAKFWPQEVRLQFRIVCQYCILQSNSLRAYSYTLAEKAFHCVWQSILTTLNKQVWNKILILNRCIKYLISTFQQNYLFNQSICIWTNNSIFQPTTTYLGPCLYSIYNWPTVKCVLNTLGKVSKAKFLKQVSF